MTENQNPPQTPINPPPVAPPPPPPPPSPESQARTWNMLCHLSALACLIGVPFGNILGPLLVWQIQKDKFPSVIQHGKAALNFQITVTIAAMVAAVVFVIGSFFCVGWLLLPVVLLIGLVGVVFAVIAAIKASNGEDYKYPFSFTFVN